MNERIKQLAEQATLAVTKPDGHYIVQAWQAKFAELIVRECACIADDMKTLETSRAIKDHFGLDIQS
jgi:hypothetical protein